LSPPFDHLLYDGLIFLFSYPYFSAEIPVSQFYKNNIIHGVFVYGGLLKRLAKESIIHVFKHFGPVMAIGFSTSSSNMHLFHLL